MEERKSRYELFLEAEQEAPKTKRCSKCKEVKALSEYHKQSGEKSGVYSQCKECVNRRNRKYKNPTDRFWKLYHDRTDNIDGCVIWNGAVHGDGQPVCQWEGKQARVRRIVYKLSIGELPDDMVVITICRNRACLRQSHLKKITQEESNVLMWNSAATGNRNGAKTCPEKISWKFQQPEYRVRGETHGRAKLTEEDVRAIRSLYAAGGVTQREIATVFGIHQIHVSQIVRRKNWAHVQ